MDKIKWETEYRQQMDIMAEWGSKEWYRLNRFLVVLLLFGVLGHLFYGVTLWMESDATPVIEKAIQTADIIIDIIGIFLVLRLYKLGFYLIVISRLLLAVALLLIPNEGIDMAWFVPLTEAAGFASALLLTNNCKINAYDLLWARDDVMRPCNFLEKHAKEIGYQ